jgi:hypothetical protein
MLLLLLLLLHNGWHAAAKAVERAPAADST